MHFLGLLSGLDKVLEAGVSLVVEVSVVSLLRRNIGSPKRPWVHVFVNYFPNIGSHLLVGNVFFLGESVLVGKRTRSIVSIGRSLSSFVGEDIDIVVGESMNFFVHFDLSDVLLVSLGKSVLVSFWTRSVVVVRRILSSSVRESIGLLVSEPMDVLFDSVLTDVFLFSLNKSVLVSLWSRSIVVIWGTFSSSVGEGIGLLVGEPMDVLLDSILTNVSLLSLNMLSIWSHRLPREFVYPWIIVNWADWINHHIFSIWNGISSLRLL